MQTKENIVDKFSLMGFSSDKERIIFEKRLRFDYTYKLSDEKPVLAKNTNNIN